MPTINIAGRPVGDGHPVYFIADIGANHDGSLERALHLIRLAAESGADAVKFQHFRAAQIVSEHGFRALGKVGHQRGWNKGVYEAYSASEVSWTWTPTLAAECRQTGVHFLSTPYDLEAVEHLAPYVPAFKVGSGDIDYFELLNIIGRQGKPVILSTGASCWEDVANAVACLRTRRLPLAVLQCTTNYETCAGVDPDLSGHNLRVVHEYGGLLPWAVLGLSDHTQSIVPVIAAITLGARIVERHFTDDCWRKGPDHTFAMTPMLWRSMVSQVRLLETALGTGVKKVEANERETAIIQRRCLRVARDLSAGTVLAREMIDVLRPATEGAIRPPDLDLVLGRRVKVDLVAGQALRWEDLE